MDISPKSTCIGWSVLRLAINGNISTGSRMVSMSSGWQWPRPYRLCQAQWDNNKIYQPGDLASAFTGHCHAISNTGIMPPARGCHGRVANSPLPRFRQQGPTAYQHRGRPWWQVPLSHQATSLSVLHHAVSCLCMKWRIGQIIRIKPG